MERLVEVVKRHQGMVAATEAEATHIILQGMDPALGDGRLQCAGEGYVMFMMMFAADEYFRPLHVRGRALMIHWLYYPDSYDSVVQLGDLGLASPPDVTPSSSPRQWRVGQRWLLDTDTFNEWMNEEDYELIQVVSRFIPLLLEGISAYAGSCRTLETVVTSYWNNEAQSLSSSRSR